MGLLAAGKTAADILAAYRYLEPDDISAALAYAAWRAEEVELPLARRPDLLDVIEALPSGHRTKRDIDQQAADDRSSWSGRG